MLWRCRLILQCNDPAWVSAYTAIVQTVIAGVMTAFTFIFYRKLVANDTARFKREEKQEREGEALKVKAAAKSALRNMRTFEGDLTYVGQKLINKFPAYAFEITEAYDELLLEDHNSNATQTLTFLLWMARKSGPGVWPTPDEWAKRKQGTDK